jgi:hypothetical protein
MPENLKKDFQDAERVCTITVDAGNAGLAILVDGDSVRESCVRRLKSAMKVLTLPRSIQESAAYPPRRLYVRNSCLRELRGTKKRQARQAGRARLASDAVKSCLQKLAEEGIASFPSPKTYEEVE